LTGKSSGRLLFEAGGGVFVEKFNRLLKNGRKISRDGIR